MQGLEHWNEMIDAHPVLTSEEEVKLAKQRDEGGRRGDRAIDKLIMHNLRAVVKRVEMMNCKPELKHDLMSAGVIKLRHAATKWTPMEGRRFYHYAFMWIREGVTREAQANWHDDQSLDAEGDDGEKRDNIVGSKEDSHEFLNAEVLNRLTEREREILKSRAIDYADETDEELAARLGVKPASVCRMLTGSIRKLLALAS